MKFDHSVRNSAVSSCLKNQTCKFLIITYNIDMFKSSLDNSPLDHCTWHRRRCVFQSSPSLPSSHGNSGEKPLEGSLRIPGPEYGKVQVVVDPLKRRQISSDQIAEQSEPFRNIEKHVGHILSCFAWLHEPAPTTSCLLLINQLL